MTRPTPMRKTGFTLIELLVVISIVALLISVLLPALGQARSHARSTICLSTMRQFGIGMQTYASNYQGWLAGPNTSGLELTDNPSGYTFKNEQTEPVQNFDWISPTMGEIRNLPNDRDERLQAIFEEEFKCPANDANYDLQFGSSVSVPGDSPISSYSINTNLVVTWKSFAPSGIYQRSWIQSEVGVDPNYQGRLDQIAAPSGKGLLADGCRYMDVDTNEMTFNGFVKQIDGGNFGTQSPGLSQLLFDGSPYKFATEDQRNNARRVAYRHPSDSLNVQFVDGHAENFREPESRRVDLWFPKGAEILDASGTDDPNDVTGQTVN